MIRSKEQILDELFRKSGWRTDAESQHKIELQAMDEYSQQVAISFIEWILKNEYISDADGFWYEQPERIYEGKYGICVAVSSPMLYTKFLESIQ